ncbi:hypothetical protein ABZ234_08105 [Nocardiopsis sp. NPDC006198]|uniref:hypothetical protein n=1 Tax=Nocardiopsis sp. NPDC006198 TaxID=3154472 RepID=UPI0033AD7B42
MTKIPNPQLPALPDAITYGLYGYGWIGHLDEGWEAKAAWGRDGWDLGAWPYVIVAVFDDATAEVHAYATYVEGGINIKAYTTAEERDASIDEVAAFYWRNYNSGPEDLAPEGQPLAPHHRGPFSWSRLKVQTTQQRSQS